MEIRCFFGQFTARNEFLFCSARLRLTAVIHTISNRKFNEMKWIAFQYILTFVNFLFLFLIVVGLIIWFKLLSLRNYKKMESNPKSMTWRKSSSCQKNFNSENCSVSDFKIVMQKKTKNFNSIPLPKVFIDNQVMQSITFDFCFILSFLFSTIRSVKWHQSC